MIIDGGPKAWRAGEEEMERGGGCSGSCNHGAGRPRGWDDGLPRPPKMYHQRGAGHGLAPKQISPLSALLAAKARMDYACIDKIFNLLLRKYCINFDNRASKWALVH
jgi:hypothetical protein